jgi:hypothetical protein
MLIALIGVQLLYIVMLSEVIIGLLFYVEDITDLAIECCSLTSLINGDSF